MSPPKSDIHPRQLTTLLTIVLIVGGSFFLLGGAIAVAGVLSGSEQMLWLGSCTIFSSVLLCAPFT